MTEHCSSGQQDKDDPDEPVSCGKNGLLEGKSILALAVDAAAVECSIGDIDAQKATIPPAMKWEMQRPLQPPDQSSSLTRFRDPINSSLFGRHGTD